MLVTDGESEEQKEKGYLFCSDQARAERVE